MNNLIINDRVDLQHIDLVIFDCDGVLVDSEAICTEVLMNELADIGVKIDKPFFNQYFLGRSYQHLTRVVYEIFNLRIADDFEKNYQGKLLDTFYVRLLPCEGIKQVLDNLAVAKCVATSSHPNRTKNVLELTGLAAYFKRNVFTASEVSHGKPAPDLFLHAAANMKIKPENCLVIEDSNAGLQAAQKAGMCVFHYTGGSHFSSENEIDYARFVTPNKRFENWNEFYSMACELYQPKIIEVNK